MSENTVIDSSATAAPFDAKTFRHTLGQFATGVVVIATEVDGEIHGMTANAFMSGSMSPPLVVVSVDKRARMHALLEQSGDYSISMLAADQENFSRHFAGQPDAQCNVHFERLDGQPVISGALAWISTRIVSRSDCGDHTLFIGEVTHLRSFVEKKALAFHRGCYVDITKP